MTAEGAAQFVKGLIAEAGSSDIHHHLELRLAIGLDRHEHPWIIPGVKDVLHAGMCFIAEPKIWAPTSARGNAKPVHCQQ